jgi:hypothetical protein
MAAALACLFACAGGVRAQDAPAGASRVVVRAVRTDAPLRLDGRLDEAVYASEPPFDAFVQQEPDEGAPATERTEVWLLFDDDTLYFSGRCWDSHPERDVANEMRRDGQGTLDNESIALTLDTFADGRNAYLFTVTLAGGLFDGYITDERDMNRDWNTVWDARTARFAQGWTFEIAIPFKSLRFGREAHPAWGVNARRIVRWKNEMSSISPLPQAQGRRAMNQVSASARLLGLETPPEGRTFEIKPYAIGGAANDRTAVPPVTDVNRDAGADAKVGITDGLTADLTYNTDFAQVEEDEQQVNLTRFSTLFPEKRDFFLEGSGIFSFGGVQSTPRGGGGGGGASGGGGTPNRPDVPVVFFSRRIGLSNGATVPIDAGGRVTGRAGAYSLGLLDIRTGSHAALGVDATNFTVARVKRDILRRSAIGALFTGRSVTETGAGSNHAYGVDGVFSFFQNLNFNTYLARTNTPGLDGRDWSYRAQMDYNADRYGLQVEQLFVDTNFSPDVGFLRRRAFRRNSAYVRFSPRPASIASVRKFTADLDYQYITDPGGHLESRAAVAGFRAEFENGDNAGAEFSMNYEFLDEPFAVSDEVSIAVGAYSFDTLQLDYQFGPQRPVSGVVTIERGQFYGGTRTSIGIGRGRVEITPQISVEPGVTVNWIDVPEGAFTSTLLTARLSYTLSPRMAVSALTQYNSDARTLGSSVRFRWEYQPGSDFFIVYTDNRDTAAAGIPAVQNRGFVLKFTRLFRM